MSFIYAVLNDLFFAERVGQALRQLGHEARVVDLSLNPGESAEQLPGGTQAVLVDLEAGEAALAVIQAASEAGLPVLAFGPHTDLALREAAKAAGAQRIVAKSKLTSSFPDLIADLIR